MSNLDKKNCLNTFAQLAHASDLQPLILCVRYSVSGKTVSELYVKLLTCMHK